MNYSVHTDNRENPVEVSETLLQFILENAVVVGVFQCINRARQALCDKYGSGSPCLLLSLILNDNATGDYLLVDLTTI